MINLLDLTIEELEESFQDLGVPKFRAHQVFDWMYKGVSDFNYMKNLPKDLRISLKSNYVIAMPKVLKRQISKEDGTEKFLLEFEDGNAIETVFMKYKYGNSICVSSQAGCRMGCKFCASTVNGLSRNLSPGEILSQILTVENAGQFNSFYSAESFGSSEGEDEDPGDLKNKKEEREERKIGHIVIMGTGEPFDNYENISKFLKLVHDPRGLNISNRNITVSTCGIVPMIDVFAKDFPQVNLAISLHGAEDDIRSSMMPINNKYPIHEVIEAARRYTDLTHRRITFEYTMVSGVNDSDRDAEKLSKLLKGMLCHVNIIPLNRVEGSGFDTVSKRRAEEFSELLKKNHIQSTVRRELGSDIDAACGQLRLKNS